MIRPLASMPCTEKTFFAKSIQTVETVLMGLPLLKRLISQTNPGTSVPPRDGEVPYIHYECSNRKIVSVNSTTRRVAPVAFSTAKQNEAALSHAKLTQGCPRSEMPRGT